MDQKTCQESTGTPDSGVAVHQNSLPFGQCILNDGASLGDLLEPGSSKILDGNVMGLEPSLAVLQDVECAFEEGEDDIDVLRSKEIEISF